MVELNLKSMSDEELYTLAAAIQTELKSRNVIDFLIDDSNRVKSRDTVESYWKVLPKSIVRKKDGYHITDQTGLDWFNERAARLGWNIVEKLSPSIIDQLYR